MRRKKTIDEMDNMHDALMEKAKNVEAKLQMELEGTTVNPGGIK